MAAQDKLESKATLPNLNSQSWGYYYSQLSFDSRSKGRDSYKSHPLIFIKNKVLTESPADIIMGDLLFWVLKQNLSPIEFHQVSRVTTGLSSSDVEESGEI
jgi:hypothetical protein